MSHPPPEVRPAHRAVLPAKGTAPHQRNRAAGPDPSDTTLVMSSTTPPTTTRDVIMGAGEGLLTVGRTGQSYRG